MTNKLIAILYFVVGYFLSAALLLEGSKLYHSMAGLFLFCYLTYQLIDND